MSLERRYLKQSGATVRLAQRDAGRVIAGRAAVFFNGTPATEYRLFDDVKERIRPGAFDRALAEGHDVRALFNHDPNNLLGRTTNGALKLWVDSRGLNYEIPVDENDFDHQRVVSKIERGDLSGSSFAFQATKISWEETSEGDVRWIEDVELFDVGPVTYPAYHATTTGLRSDELKRERELWRQAESGWRERWLKLQKLKADIEKSDWRAEWLAARRKLT